jgi:hypothetical protein
MPDQRARGAWLNRGPRDLGEAPSRHRRNRLVLHRTFVAELATVAMLALVAGCAGRGATSSTFNPGASSSASELRGTWTGSFGWVGASLYEAEARLTLEIREDGTFTATVTPDRGANNLTKASTLSGTAVTGGNRVTLQNSQGPWPWVTLVRSGNTLYGVASDPASQANVMLKFEREGSRG